jgi:hypothetical protein
VLAIITGVNASRCQRCQAEYQAGDNFCRRCGNRLAMSPAVQPARAVVRRTPGLPPSLVSSVAVLAVGTGLEWLARRLVSTAARSAGRALAGEGDIRPQPTTPPPAPKQEAPLTATIDEIVVVRKVQLRR